MICVECSAPIHCLYERYKGNHIRLTICDACHNVADKYIEYDKVLLFIDLILMKPKAYKHTIYNLLLASLNNDNAKEKKSYSSVIRLAILMLLFEVYITWAYQEKNFVVNPASTSMIIKLVLIGPLQYLYFLSTSIFENAVLCLSLTYFAHKLLNFTPATATHHYSNTFSRTPSLSPIPFESRSPSLSPSISPSLSSSPISSPFLRINSIPSTPALSSTTTSTIPIIVTNNSNTDIKKPLVLEPREQLCIFTTTVVISNTIRLFPIVMLIWPYDPPILHTTRILVRFIHFAILIEAIHIVLLHNKGNEYWKVTLVVLLSQFVQTLVTHAVIAVIFSAFYRISIAEMVVDEFKQLLVTWDMITELYAYMCD